MSKLRKRRKEKKEELEEVEEAEESQPSLIYKPIATDRVVSTGSTLLDLAISGKRVRGGGIPPGIMVELFGPSSSGKTTLLVEIGASVQDKGGEVNIADPEARLDDEYTKQHGLKVPADNYTRPDTVKELFGNILTWEPENEKAINLYGADSIAALSTDMEMSKDGDKRGQRKAKELSEGCRKTARIISQDNKLVVFTNQERQAEFGKTTPGGFAVGYHASLRIHIARANRVEPTKKLASGVSVKKTIGIHSKATVVKSSIDDEYRVAPVYIIFGFGIDDVRANLQYLKDMTKGSKYDAVDKSFKSMDYAIKHIETNNLEHELRENVIDMWEEIELKFQRDRKKKVRF
jgi:recombination protein RecA